MKKKKKNEASEELYRQSKIMLVSFVMLGFLMVSIILMNTTLTKGTYSASGYCVGRSNITVQHTCEMAGYEWREGVVCTYTSIYECENRNRAACALDSDGCPVVTRVKTCEEFNSHFYTNCPSDSYCGNKNNYGCYEVVGKYAYFYSWDGQSYIAKCVVQDGSLTNCDNNPMSTCAGWSTSTYSNTNNANFSSGGQFYCAADYSVHNGCCRNNSGTAQSPTNKHDCEAAGYNWTCQNSNTPTPTTKPNTPTPTTKPNTPTPTTKANTPTPTTKANTPTPTVAPTKSCYVCVKNSKSQHVYATSAENAASAATTLRGVTASNCSVTDDSNCQEIRVESCYECTDGNGKTKHVNAYSEGEAKTQTKYNSCEVVSKDKCNTTVNPKTGPLAIIIAWSIGLFAIGYAYWYFKKTLVTEK